MNKRRIPTDERTAHEVWIENERLRALRPGEPCGHPGCLSHITHPCEGCGRIGGQPGYVAVEIASGEHLRLIREGWLTHHTDGFTTWMEKH